VGAIGSLTINGGSIVAEGGFVLGGYGGGSGGGILLHAPSVSLAGADALDVSGGSANGAAGGGGRTLILTNTCTTSGTGIFNLAGGPAMQDGGGGVLTVGSLPEPSSIILLAIALPVLAICIRRGVVSWHARRAWKVILRPE
jgi:hypothetical protein